MNKFKIKKAEVNSTENLVGDAANKLKTIVPYLKGNIKTQSPFTNEKANIDLSPVQWLSTFDKSFKSKYPALAALNEVNSPSDYKLSPAFNLGSQLSNAFRSYRDFTNPILDSGPLLGGLYSIAPGALIGALSTGAYNLFKGNDLTENMWRNTAIGGGLGGLLGAVSGYYRTHDIDPMDAAKAKILTPSQIDEVRKQERKNVENAMVSE